MSLSESEFTALRTTIATRGTVRVVLVPITLIGWAVLASVVLLFGDLPVAAVPPLVVLAAGFEGINALHVGVERIGRYVQVFYEGSPGDPGWETTAMAAGPRLPGGGVDPLFSIVFAGAAIVNMTTALVPEPTPLETLVIGALHTAFLLRIARARQLATSQRGRDLHVFLEARAARDTAGRSSPAPDTATSSDRDADSSTGTEASSGR
jgi:hypothetical protein